ncbi:glycosyltransferase [Paracrocinitomix mangrovi]|uniref:glycosyltransferase n=1 Tax=Paracrocinitomix mangrovi TaxID=2862509 RepID=UPI001C8D1C3C|nr:glycosyltransferase [Paracrocinitomix mangrovi]UKN02868.1 glycosyltransferase [Paracrocinitomix mangrovi]
MQLSVIIVNYNVEFFLEQCLNSVYTALKHVEGEVFVVDNNSIDGSLDMVRSKFPEVQLIANKDNVGFSRANNQAIKISKGKYVLLLNPDTIVEEDTFQKVVAFMDEHPDAGGLGVKMIDGKGNFLPESKRGLPTPKVAFYKIFGLSRLFPRSKKFGKYHLSYLDKNETHEIEILSGAFMLMRKEALDKVGLLDENFFMYGEDIDLSYRIILGGYKNYYYPGTRIIHYKGESTKKSSVNYVFVFYNAMIIFARKHFSEKNARLYSFLINMAIYFRASLALVSRFVKKAFIPFIDIICIILGLFLIAQNYMQIENKLIPEQLLFVALPVYGAVWFLSQIFVGGYDKPIRLIKNIIGALVGTAVILVVYALLSKDYQFSRLIILMGGTWVTVYYIVSRLILHNLVGENYRIGGAKNKRFAIVGDAEESERVHQILLQTNSKIQSVRFLSSADEKSDQKFIGTINQLDQVIDIHNIDEVIFCAKNVSAGSIISKMLELEERDVDFKIAQPESSFLIGSNSIDSKGDLYVMDINRINKPANRRNKRMIDVGLSLILMVLSPVLIFLYKKKGQFLKNMLGIFIGKLSFVGYAPIHHASNLKLPSIKRGVLTCEMVLPSANVDEDSISRMNLIYAKNHSFLMDLKIIFRNFNQLDR